MTWLGLSFYIPVLQESGQHGVEYCKQSSENNRLGITAPEIVKVLRGCLKSGKTLSSSAILRGYPR